MDMMDEKDLVVRIADENTPEEIRRFAEEQARLKKRKEEERIARRTEINREIARKKRQKKKENDPQMTLFGDGK